MKLKALDQIHISAVKPDSLRPGEEFEVGDEQGAALLKTHPSILQNITPSKKARAKHPNKAEGDPPNKAAPKRKTKAEA